MLLEMEIYECDGDDLRETIWRSSIYSLYLFFLKSIQIKQIIFQLNACYWCLQF